MGPRFFATRSNYKLDHEHKKYTYCDIPVTVVQNGQAEQALSRIRLAILDQMKERFAHRSVLHRLAWLNVSEWPQDDALTRFAVDDITALFCHWQSRLEPHGVQLPNLLQELEQVKVVWKTALKPILDPHAFWKDIIQHPKEFPAMHIFLRMTLALTPSDAVVESAFSGLRLILGDRRLALSSRVVEELLVLVLDTAPWTEYDYTHVLAAQRSSQRRARFRNSRTDKGRKRGAKSMSKKSGVLKPSDLLDDSDTSTSANVPSALPCSSDSESD